MIGTTTIRVSTKTYQVLKELAEQENVNMTKMVDKAVEKLKKEKFFNEMNTAYTTLQQNPKQWKEEQDERKQWSNTLGDSSEGVR
jgi:DNA-binding transcriptional regulator YhcF (GntR family)